MTACSQLVDNKQFSPSVLLYDLIVCTNSIFTVINVFDTEIVHSKPSQSDELSLNIVETNICIKRPTGMM